MLAQYPLHYFDKIYIINLAYRLDRRNEMDHQLRKIGLSIDAPAIELFPAVRPVESAGFSSIGAHGCYLSHLGILRRAAGQNFRRILILEDDVNFCSDFNTQAAHIFRSLEEQTWHIFYGGYRLPSREHLGSSTFSVSHDCPIMLAHFIGLCFPAIDAAATFLETLMTRQPGDPNGGPMHVDGAYSWFRRHNPQFITVLAVPQLGYQRASRTDIHALRWFDRYPLVRLGVSLVRALKNLRRSTHT